MEVVGLWRFPVKSLGGERLEHAQIGEQGLDGDRSWAIWDVEEDIGLTARRVPEMLFAGARLRADGTPEITLPDGAVVGDGPALSRWLGRPVELRAADGEACRTYENTTDFEREETAPWRTFSGAPGRFHDSESARVSIVSRETIGAWDGRRFRSNVLLSGGGEDGLVGVRVRLGSAVLRLEERIARCVMVTRPQPDGIERELDVLRLIARERAGQLAVGATVEQSGRTGVGDCLELSP